MSLDILRLKPQAQAEVSHLIAAFNGNKMITTSGGGALICRNAEDANEVMWYATQARDAYPYYQHTAIGYGSTGSPQALTACRTDGAARGEPSLLELSRVVTEEDEVNVCAGIGRGEEGL